MGIEDKLPKPSKQKKQAKNVRSSKVKKLSDAQVLALLDRQAMEFVPPISLSSFNDLPISDNTKRGLKKAFYVKMTDIQTQSIPVCLKCKDVLGAARTGSGKTLSFLIPVLEVLYRKKWGPQDGLGALIISPTRELAVQIFDVLRAIGGYHSFSAGLVIGGKNVKEERDRLSRMNILVATPGRLLQHMDQAFGFDADNLQLLVLDEADRILDMGFARTLNALLSHLPKSRQTLLFSATQTNSIKDLARLSLKDPVYVGVKEQDTEAATPKSLEQHYVLCELHKKLDILWSFIKSHLQSKILVFLSSGKQVRFVFETFRRMHPGIPLLHLHGRQKQATRLGTFSRFTSTSHSVLFATDIAARGLDFPSVDWVVQVDCPEDVETYIHRIGRTARYDKSGKGLLLLLPSEEEGMKSRFESKSIEVSKIKIKESKTQSIDNQLQNLAFQEPEIKYLAQRAFVSYLKSIYIQKDKDVFHLDKMPVEEFAASLGLPGAPNIKFLTKNDGKAKKNASRDVEKLQADAKKDVPDSSDAGEDSELSSGSESEDHDDILAENVVKPSKNSGVRTKYDRMFERKNQNILSEHYTKLVDHSLGAVAPGNASDDDDFITLKRADHDLEDNIRGESSQDPKAMKSTAQATGGSQFGIPSTSNTLQPPPNGDLSKRALKLGVTKRGKLKSAPASHHIKFDDEGGAHELYEMRTVETEFAGQNRDDVLRTGKQWVEGEQAGMRDADVKDREEAKEKKREKKRKRKEKERMGYDSDNADIASGAALHAPSGDEDDGYISPEFDLAPLSASEEEEYFKDIRPPTKKKQKTKDNPRTRTKPPTGLEDEEDLALQLLNR